MSINISRLTLLFSLSRTLQSNFLTGTLPQSWSSMVNIQHLYAPEKSGHKFSHTGFKTSLLDMDYKMSNFIMNHQLHEWPSSELYVFSYLVKYLSTQKESNFCCRSVFNNRLSGPFPSWILRFSTKM